MENKAKQTEITRYKFNVDQYYKMADVGILPWGQGQELHSGVVWDQSPLVRNRCHPMLNGGVTRFLNEAAGLTDEDEGHIHKYTVEEYHVMGETDILTPNDRVELIDGEIVLMPPMNSPHASVTNFLVRLLNRMLGDDEAFVWAQCPITFPGNAEPEPDVALLRPRADFYRSNLPTPRDALLLIEVSQTTLRYDHTVKLPLYALNGIPEFWIVNLAEDTVEVYRHPEGASYQESTRRRRGDTASPQAFPGITLEVSEILG